jgi:hypothetical protein
VSAVSLVNSIVPYSGANNTLLVIYADEAQDITTFLHGAR